MPWVAACAVRTLARTDTFMPMKPQAPECLAPTTKPTAVAPSRNTPISTASTTPTRAMVLYWRARQAAAPAWMAAAISCMRALPGSLARIQPRAPTP